MCLIFFLPEYMIYIGAILVVPAFIVCIYGMLSLRKNISKERREFILQVMMNWFVCIRFIMN